MTTLASDRFKPQCQNLKLMLLAPVVTELFLLGMTFIPATPTTFLGWTYPVCPIPCLFTPRQPEPSLYASAWCPNTQGLVSSLLPMNAIFNTRKVLLTSTLQSLLNPHWQHRCLSTLATWRSPSLTPPWGVMVMVSIFSPLFSLPSLLLSTTLGSVFSPEPHFFFCDPDLHTLKLLWCLTNLNKSGAWWICVLPAPPSYPDFHSSSVQTSSLVPCTPWILDSPSKLLRLHLFQKALPTFGDGNPMLMALATTVFGGFMVAFSWKLFITKTSFISKPFHSDPLPVLPLPALPILVFPLPCSTTFRTNTSFSSLSFISF